MTAAPSDSAVPRCQGKKATIVSSKTFINGTPRADVIVAIRRRNVVDVSGKGGDDLICLIGSGSSADGGPGNDVIRVVGKRSSADVQLGPGRDTFIGGPNDDYVFAFRASDSAGNDTIRTGGGNDSVQSGWRGTRDRDHVRLGTGTDHLVVAGETTGAYFDGGADPDELTGPIPTGAATSTPTTTPSAAGSAMRGCTAKPATTRSRGSRTPTTPSTAATARTPPTAEVARTPASPRLGFPANPDPYLRAWTVRSGCALGNGRPLTCPLQRRSTGNPSEQGPHRAYPTPS